MMSPPSPVGDAHPVGDGDVTTHVDGGGGAVRGGDVSPGSLAYPIVDADDVLTPVSAGGGAGGRQVGNAAAVAAAAAAADSAAAASPSATPSPDGASDGISPQVARVPSSSEEDLDEDDEALDDDEDSAVRGLSLREDPDGPDGVGDGAGDGDEAAASGADGDRSRPADEDDDPAAWCIICFERAPNVELRPCTHANICLDCVVRLVKRRCPTCRARVRRIRLLTADAEAGVDDAEAAIAAAAALGMPPADAAGTLSLRELISARKQREVAALDSTLQIVFVGPPAVGKKSLVRKLCAKWPLRPPGGPGGAAASGAAADGAADASAGAANGAAPTADIGVNGNGDGTDFRPNVTLPGGIPARLTVLRRTLITSRRMLLDDVRLLRPDALVLCCAAGDGCASFGELLSFDRVLRASIAAPRLWAVVDGGGALSVGGGLPGGGPDALWPSPAAAPSGSWDGSSTSGGGGGGGGSGGRSPLGAASVTSDATLRDSVGSALASVNPASVRPRGLYFVTPSAPFSMGLRALARDLVEHGRGGREAAIAAAAARANVGSIGRGVGAGAGAGVRNVQFRSVVVPDDGRMVAGVNRMLNWLVGDT